MKTFNLIRKLTVLLTLGVLMFPISGYSMTSHQTGSNISQYHSNCDGGCSGGK